jgi:hypothetical protein
MKPVTSRRSCFVVLAELLSDTVVFITDQILAIQALEAADREMASRDVLKVFDECVVLRGAAKGADDRECLGGGFLRNDQSEPRGDLGDELQQNGRTFLDHAAFGDEPRGLGYCLGQHPPDGEVSALGCVGRSGPTAQCEDFDA